MKIIIAATDFSKNANNAVQYAASLAKEFNSKLMLVHTYLTFAKKNHNNETEEEVKREARQKLIVLGEKASTVNNIDVEAHLITGETAAETIVQFADKMQAELIVAGSTGTNLVERLIMGTTTSRLVHHSKCPVLCIPARSKFEPIKRIAFATDLKEDNINAALSLVTFAQHFNAEISFLFVDDKDLIHDEKTIAEMTARIRNRVHYPKLSGYITKHTDIHKGIMNFLKQQSVQVMAMYTHADESTSIRFSESITAEMSDHTSIPLLALKKGTVTLVQ